MAAYISDRVSDMYGNNQELYVKKTQETVDATVKKFHEAVEQKRDLEDLFHETIDFLGTTRNEIASEHESSAEKRFGIRRDRDFTSPSHYTILNYQYEEYNKKLITILQDKLINMSHTLREFQQKESSFEEDACLGRKFKRDVSILDTGSFPNFYTLTEADRLCKITSFTPSNKPTALKELMEDKKAMQTLKKKSPTDYKQLKLLHVVLELRKVTEWRKSDWVLVTNRLQVGNQMCALTQYLTWMYRDYENDPVQRMTDRSVVMVLHQDVFLLESMLKDTARVFKEAIEWNKADGVKTLQDRVALLRYELDHAMPFHRGSAAIAEWLEQSIYQYHSFSLSYNKMVNLEALTSTFSEFVQSYDSMVTLTQEEGVSKEIAN